MLTAVPITQKRAREFVAAVHRHNLPPRGDVIRVGVTYGVLVAVGLAGRPVAPELQDGVTLEITRVASTGAPNACSLIYGRLRRAAFALGWVRVVTYTRDDEPGTSLRAAGFRLAEILPARRPASTWSNRPDRAPYDAVGRARWESP